MPKLPPGKAAFETAWESVAKRLSDNDRPGRQWAAGYPHAEHLDVYTLGTMSGLSRFR